MMTRAQEHLLQGLGEGLVLRVWVKETEIVLRMGTQQDIDETMGSEVMRVGWPYHLHRPKEPLHPDLMNLLGESMGRLAQAAFEAGQDSKARQLRRALGVT